MTISTLKDLEKLVKLCRKLGVNAIKVDNIEFALGSLPVQSRPRAISDIPDFNITNNVQSTEQLVTSTLQQADPTELTEEQLLYYSAGVEQ